MKILYICYSCSPYNGTEDKLGWYIPYEISKKHDVWIITKPDGKNEIEGFLNEKKSSIRVLYFDIPNIFKKIYNGPFYSGRLNIWNNIVEKKLSNIISENGIELIHQVNPVEFRSIGNYGKFGVPFICGPVGGGEYMPKPLLPFAKNGLDKELIRYILNIYYKTKYKYFGRIKSIDKLLFVNEETRNYLIGNTNATVMTELGAVFDNEIDDKILVKDDKIILLAAGRLIYRKGNNYLFKAIEQIPDKYDFELVVLGNGPEEDNLRKQVAKSSMLTKRVQMLGKVPHTTMREYYQKASFFVMPSLRETTGSVILEALEVGIPVITMNAFGAKNLLNETNSVMYSISQNNPVKSLKDAIIYGIENRDKYDPATIRENAKIFSFESKAIEYTHMYEELLER